MVDDGSKGYYSSGTGTVVVVQGAWKNDLNTVNDTSNNNGQNAAEAPYFAELMGSNTTGSGLGFVKYTVSQDRIDVQTSFSSTFQDSFSIVTPQAPLSASFNYSPATPTVGSQVSFAATASGGVPPYIFAWNFGDSTTGSGSSVTHTYSAQGTYTVALTVTDSASPTANSQTTSQPLTVSLPGSSWNPNVVCSATQITLAQEYNGGSLTGSAWQTSSSTGGIPNKRALSPPCTVTNTKGQVVSTFVQFNGVYIANSTIEDCATSYNSVNGGGPYPDRNGDGNSDAYCDTTGPVQVVGTSDIIHYEIDHDWDAAGYCGPGVPPCDNVTLRQELSSGTVSLDLQGFVFWDSGDLPGHWELHPLTGWKLSSSPPPQLQPLSASFAYSPTSPSPGISVTFTATAGGGVPPYSFAWDFGDGTKGSGNPVAHSYSVQGTYTVNLTVKDSVFPNPNAKTVAQSLTVSPPVFAVGISGPSSGTAGTGVSFTATASSGTAPYSFSWNFGDGAGNIAGGSANPNTQTHTYTKSGTFTVNVNATDANGKRATASSTIRISTTTPPLSVSISGPGSGILGSSLGFAATATGGAPPYSFSWTAAGGSPASGTGSSFTTIFNTQGKYTVSVTATDAGGKVASSSTTVNVNSNSNMYTLTWQGFDWDGGGEETLTVNGLFLASLPATDSPQNANVYVAFSLNITSFVVQGTNKLTFTHANWDCSTIDNVKNLQVASGTTVVYSNSTVEPLSCTQSLAYTFTTTSPPPPPAAATVFTYSPTNPTAGQAVTFTATASNGMGPYTFTWDFGDGSAGSGQTVTHVYGQAGEFTVKLTVTDSSQNTATSAQTVAVTTSTLTVNFTFTPSTITPGSPVTFTATVSGGTSPYSYSWSFGDGTTGTGNPVSHTYSNVGPYTVTLTVTDSQGSTATTSQTLTGTLATGFTYSPSSPVVGQVVTFNATGSGGTPSYSFSWNLGDGTSASGSIVTHVYSTNGTYTVTVTARDSGGQTATASKTVSVAPSTPPPQSAYALVISAEGKVFRYQNGTLTLIGQPVTTALRQVAWKPDGSYALIIGDSGVVLKYDGNQLTRVSLNVAATTNFQTVAWKPDGSYALIGGENGVLLKYSDVSITSIPSTTTTTIRGIGWNPSGSSALLVGSRGLMLLYQASSGVIQKLSSGTTQYFYAVAWNPNGQYALAAGSNATLVKYDGTQVAMINTIGIAGQTLTIRSIAWNALGTIAVMVGDQGLVLTYDGSTLTAQPVLTGNWLFGVAWSGNTATIVGGAGTIITYSSGTEKKLASGATPALRWIAWKPA